MIRPYAAADEAALFALLREEGDDWKDYWGHSGRERYAQALALSSTFVAYEGDALAGFVRCKNDHDFEVVVYDLLVRKQSWGRQIGRALMSHVAASFPDVPVYVMSDVDSYYEKQGYRRIGSVFQVE